MLIYEHLVRKKCIFFGKRKLRYLACLKSNETLFFVSSLKIRCCLKKSQRKILKIFGRKIFSNISPKNIFQKNIFSKFLKIFHMKNFRSNFFHMKNLKEFWKNVFLENIFWGNVWKYFSTKNFQYFSLRFFLNSIYSSRRIRKIRFHSILSKLNIVIWVYQKNMHFFVLNVHICTLNFGASMCNGVIRSIFVPTVKGAPCRSEIYRMHSINPKRELLPCGLHVM